LLSWVVINWVNVLKTKFAQLFFKNRTIRWLKILMRSYQLTNNQSLTWFDAI